MASPTFDLMKKLKILFDLIVMIHCRNDSQTTKTHRTVVSGEPQHNQGSARESEPATASGVVRAVVTHPVPMEFGRKAS